MSNQQEVMLSLIREYEDFDKQLDRRFCLYLNCYARKQKTLNLCWSSGSLSKTKMDSLMIVGISNLSKEELIILDNFLKY
mmetsp:Transcript_764/g.740  ORF Transcript_764/g.740 Transcript_764/m.740 type:complete len:80 (+) Transcript_764:186-425(+)